MFDNSWQALLRPGDAEDWFRFRAPFAADADGFELGNACWLAELSRLCYRDDLPGRRSRAELLAAVGLREVFALARRDTFCALVEGGDGGRRFACLLFRGTATPRDWLRNLRVLPRRWPGGGKVHRGFLRAFGAVWPALRRRLEPARPLFVAGHSLGGALAALAAAALRPRAVYTFGMPRVGDAAFAGSLRAPLFRLVNRSDLVARVPPAGPPLQFVHCGERWRIGDDGALDAGGDDPDAPELEQAAGDRRWYDPPPFLADHAPVNYVAALQRLL